MPRRSNIHLFLDRNRFVPETIKDWQGEWHKTSQKRIQKLLLICISFILFRLYMSCNLHAYLLY